MLVGCSIETKLAVFLSIYKPTSISFYSETKKEALSYQIIVKKIVNFGSAYFVHHQFGFIYAS